MKSVLIAVLCLVALVCVGASAQADEPAGELLRQRFERRGRRAPPIVIQPRRDFRRFENRQLQRLLLGLASQGQNQCHCHGGGGVNLLGLLNQQQQCHCHGGGANVNLLQLLQQQQGHCHGGNANLLQLLGQQYGGGNVNLLGLLNQQGNNVFDFLRLRQFLRRR